MRFILFLVILVTLSACNVHSKFYGDSFGFMGLKPKVSSDNTKVTETPDGYAVRYEFGTSPLITITAPQGGLFNLSMSFISGNGFSILTNECSDKVFGSCSIRVSTPLSGISSILKIVYITGDKSQGEIIIHFDGPYSTVRNAFLFYNDSEFDGLNPGASEEDDDAIVSNILPLLPGETGSSANLSNYSMGINGIMVDLEGTIEQLQHISAEDLDIRLGTSNDLGAWTAGPTPTVSLRSLSASVHRLTLIFPSASIRNTFVRVSVKANAHTNLSEEYPFYFANLAGDVDKNGTVEMNDINLVAAVFGQPHQGLLHECNVDRRAPNINIGDISSISANYGKLLLVDIVAP